MLTKMLARYNVSLWENLRIQGHVNSSGELLKDEGVCNYRDELKTIFSFSLNSRTCEGFLTHIFEGLFFDSLEVMLALVLSKSQWLGS